MSEPIYLSALAVNAFLQVSLNGVPVLTSPENTGINAMADVSGWIVPGTNMLGVRLYEPLLEPAVEARVSLFLHDPAEEVVTPGVILGGFAWPPEREDPAEPVPPLPYAVEVPIEIADPPPTRLWREAGPVGELTEADRQRLLGLVEELRQRLMSRDAAGATRLLDYKLVDDALASGKPPERARSAAQELLEWAVESPLQSQPLAPGEAEFQVVGRGRIVLVRRPGGVPALRLYQPSTDNLFSIDVYAARLGGDWRIVR